MAPLWHEARITELSGHCMHWSGHGASHVGRREQNEDSFCIAPECGLFVVADGMGGYEGGEIASRLAVDSLRTFFLPVEHREDQFRARNGQDAVAAQRMDLAIRLAHQEIASAARGHLEDMGTTVAAILAHGPGLVVAHVGDSRVYRLRGGELEALTADHSVMAEMLACGHDRATLPARYQHIVTRCLAPTSTGFPDLRLEEALPGDRFLLCSDGLTDVLDDAHIGRILAENAAAQAPHVLIEAAFHAGSLDNITAVVVEPA